MGLGIYYQAFLDLISSRVNGFIAWHFVQQYAILKGFDDEQCEILHAVIRSLDMEYVKYMEANKK